jgi:hypothetical protein
MKTKFYWFALLASAALIAQAQAGGHHGGGGFVGGGGSHISSPAHAAGPSFHSMPHSNFGGGRFVAPGQRFSAMGGRLSSNAFRQHYINRGPAIGTRQFTPRDFNRGMRVTRFENRGNRPGQIASPTGERSGAIQNQTGGNGRTRFGNNPHDPLAQPGNRVGEHNGAVRNRGGQVRNGNNLPANWRNHIAGQRSANWHRDWDRHRDHFWHGHRCRFVNGSWFIFDFGFPWYPYAYPYDYYAYDFYPYQYDPGVYEGDDGDYYGQGAYDSSDEYADSTVSAAQAQLSRQGYYRGEIDGIFGPETRRAVMRYQSDHDLRMTGRLNADTLHALGLPRVASN